MKTIALILLLTCFGLWAQSPPAVTDTNDSAAKDEILRRAVRDTISGTNAATADKVSDTTGTSPVPPAPQSQIVPPLKRSVRNLPLTVVETNTPAVTVVNGANPIIINTSTNPVVVTAATNPVVLAAPPVPVPVVPAATPVVVPAATPLVAAPQPPPVIPVNPLPVRPNRAVATSAAAQPPEQIIHAGEIDFPGVGVDQFLEFYAKLVGRTILRAPNLPAPQITLQTQTDLTKSEAIQAFESILAMNGVAMVNVGDKFVKAVPSGIVGTIGTPFSTNDASELAEVDKFVTEIVHIQNAKPSELVQVLAPYAQIQNNILAIDSSGMLIIRDYSVNVKRMMELIKQIDVLTPLEYESEVIPIKYAKASEISSALSSLGGNTSATIGSAPAGSGRSVGGFTPGGAGSGTLGGQQGGYQQPGTPGSLTGGLNSQSRTSSFADRLKQLGLKSANGAGGAGDFNILGTTKIIADERTNSLLVFASKQDLAMIKKIIKELDTVLAQVLIEAIIMEVTIDDSRSLGVSYLQKTPSQPGNYFSGIGAINNGALLNNQNFSSSGTNGTGALPGGFSYLAHFGNDFDATVTAIANDNRIHVLSRPWVQTSHAVTATLKIGDTVPYVTGTYFGGINGQASSQYQQTFVGIDLEVTPLINPDGLVVMDITQDIQQLGTPTIIDNNPVPTTTQRSAQAKVSVRDGDTIILGGFISNTKSKSKSGVPLLKDIPGLGYLFRSTSDSNKRVELIVLIRPTVLPNPESAALLATRKQNKLPGVKAALAEDRIDENKRIKAADSIKVPPEHE